MHTHPGTERWQTGLAPWVEGAADTFGFFRARLWPILDLVIRVALAKVFFVSGVLKAMSWLTTVQLYTTEHPVPGLTPETAATIGTGIELVCPILLTLGLFTRLASLPLLLTAAFLQFTYVALPDHLFWMAFLAMLVLGGAGPISLDRLIGPHLANAAVPLAREIGSIGTALRRFGLPLLLAVLRLWLAALIWNGLLPAQPALVQAFGLLFCVSLAAGFATHASASVLLLLLAVLPGSAAIFGDPLNPALLLASFGLRGGGCLAIDRILSRRIQRWFPALAPTDAWLADAPRVVIVGAGFGGIAAAQGLRYARARVTLIDRRNYHLFQPLLYQVATASLSPADIATPIRSLVRDQRNCTVLMGRVSGLDRDAGCVRVGDRSVPYDLLVLATGARHSYFGKDAWEPLAPGLKKIDDATAMRGRILAAFELAEGCDDDAERCRLMTFVIVGAGPTGVELAGAIAELARHGLQGEFRRADPAAARVILVQSAPRVLPAMAEPLSSAALAALQQLGVDVRLNARVEQIDEDGVTVGGERIAAGTVLWAAGVMASAAGRWLDAQRDNAGRVIVNPDLSVPDTDGVWAIGDTAACPGPNGSTLPGLAAVAKQQGRHVAHAIRARIEGSTAPGAFRYRDLGTMATIGRKAAVADILGVKLSGASAWWLWSIVHVAFLVDGRARVAVLLDWFWSYLTYGRSMRLITGRESGAD
jgi:NADH dehydrogenase, FAD-containing subunit